MNDAKSLGNRLKQVRISLGISTADMAARFGLRSRTTWEIYERENKPPKADILAELALTGFSGHWLLTGQGKMMTADSEESISSTTNVEPEGPTLDRDLMETVIRLTEEALQSRNQNIAPDKKAVLFSMIHDMILEEEQEEGAAAEISPSIADKINNLIRLAS